MNPWRLLIALLILLGLGGAVWYSQRHPAEPKSEFKTEKVVSVAEDQIRHVEILRPPEEPVALEKGDDAKWRITLPKPFKADESAIGSMISNFATMNADAVVADKNSDWKTYGLENPKVEVQATLKDGKKIEVEFGDNVPTSSAVYARLAGDPRLFTIANYVKNSFDKPVSDLRDKHLVAFETDKLSRVTLATKNQALEFDKAGTNWQIVKPHPLRADTFAIDGLVRSVHDASFDSVLDESGKPQAKYSFAAPLATFQAVDAGGVHTLTVGEQTKDKTTEYYAKSSDLPGVYKVTKTLGDDLDKKLADLRSKKLFDFGFADPDRIELRDGQTRLTIEKKGDKWLRADANNKELPSDKVQTLIDHLRNLTAKSFPADDAASQAKYGLGHPATEAKVTSDNGKQVDDVLIAPGPDSKYYAAREKEPATYEIDKSGYEDLQKDIALLK